MQQIIQRSTSLGALTIFLMLTPPAWAQVPCEYDVTIIQAPTDCGQFGTVNTFGLGINEYGAVVGRYQCPLWEHTEAFVWTAEDGFVTLDRPEGVYSASAIDINDNGVICGTAWLFDLGQRGFVYDHGKWTILDPVVPDGGLSSASAINNAGVVVGQRSITKNLNPQNAYFWSAEEGFTDLGVMNGPNSAARDINEQGDICGWTGVFLSSDEAFVWSDGKLRLLGPIPGGTTSIGSGINAFGKISGAGLIPMDGYQFGIPLAFMWQKGKFTIIEPIIGYDTSSLGDINDEGLITGTSVNLDQPTDRHGYLWINGITNDLNGFVSGESGVVIETAAGISDNGAIVANGDDGNDEIAAFLLTPINAPLGDLNDDCIVDISDLSILLMSWGRCPKGDTCKSDLDQNGITSTNDLLILFANWG